MNNNDENKVQNREIELNDVIYSIDEKNKTASVERYNNNNKTSINSIFIPHMIYDESKEYVVKSISKHAFYFSKIESISFAKDSEIDDIQKGAFISSSIRYLKLPPLVTKIKKTTFNNCKYLTQIDMTYDSKLQSINCAFEKSSLESITIPSQLVKLKEKWCSQTKIKKAFISPRNKRYCLFNDNIIIGKTKIEQNFYDLLVFCCRNTKTIIIPSFIKHICPYAFENSIFQNIKILNNSQLEIIDEYSFSSSSIESITIPKGVKEIKKDAFCLCEKLKKIQFSKDSKLQIIDKEAFFGSAIDSIIIPSQVNQLKSKIFFCCDKLQIMEINEDSKLKSIHPDVFKNWENGIIMIPSKLSNILPINQKIDHIQENCNIL